MINAQRQRVEQEMTQLVDDLDKSQLRKMQRNMHHCAANCCESNESMESVQRCVQSCSAPVEKAQRFVQSELERVQGRLQRCVMDCNDSVKDKMPPNPSESEIAKYTDQFERCAIKCVDSSISSLPNLFKTIKSVLSSKSIPDV